MRMVQAVLLMTANGGAPWEARERARKQSDDAAVPTAVAVVDDRKIGLHCSSVVYGRSLLKGDVDDVMTFLGHALRDHDWFYQFSEDIGVYRRGDASFGSIAAALRAADALGMREQAVALALRLQPQNITIRWDKVG